MSLTDYKNPILTTEAHDHCEAQMAKVKDMLHQIRINPYLMLCYVDTGMPTNMSVCSPVGVAIMPTVGGQQYCISEYFHGRSSSGSYYPEGIPSEAMLEDIRRRIRYYHRTTPFSIKYGTGKHHLNQFMLVRNPYDPNNQNLELDVEECPEDMGNIDFFLK